MQRGNADLNVFLVLLLLLLLSQLVLGADMGQRLRGVHNCIRRLMDTGAALLAHCSSGSQEGRQHVQQVGAVDWGCVSLPPGLLLG